MPPVPPFRLYIDESGDHTYKNVADLGGRRRPIFVIGPREILARRRWTSHRLIDAVGEVQVS